MNFFIYLAQHHAPNLMFPNYAPTKKQTACNGIVMSSDYLLFKRGFC